MKKNPTNKPLRELRSAKTTTLIEVLGDYEDRMSKKSDQTGVRRTRTRCPKQIEVTIRHLAKLYSNSRITNEKKSFLEKTIKEADTRAMAILTILRNR